MPTVQHCNGATSCSSSSKTSSFSLSLSHSFCVSSSRFVRCCYLLAINFFSRRVDRSAGGRIHAVRLRLSFYSVVSFFNSSDHDCFKNIYVLIYFVNVFCVYPNNTILYYITNINLQLSNRILCFFQLPALPVWCCCRQNGIMHSVRELGVQSNGHWPFSSKLQRYCKVYIHII